MPLSNANSIPDGIPLTLIPESISYRNFKPAMIDKPLERKTRRLNNSAFIVFVTFLVDLTVY